MPEILTESFCERCGTRYTFESAAPPKARSLGRFKTLSKGLKNYVLSDDTSMDEAMAAARSDEERELTSHQLDAFHSTFNFCMTCRQYTCSNCWNQVDGQCLTCAPHLGHEIMPAPFPELTPLVPADSLRFDAAAWPMSDLAREAEATRPDLDAAEAIDRLERLIEPPVAAEAPVQPAEVAPAPLAWPVEAELAAFEAEAETEALKAEAEAEALRAQAEAEALQAQAEADALQAQAEVLKAEAAAEALRAEAAAEALRAEAAAEALRAEAEAEAERVAVPAPVEAAAISPDTTEIPGDVDDLAAAAALRTSALLAKFRPGQNIDAELEAFEATAPDESAALEEPTEVVVAEIATEPALVAEPEHAAAEIAPEPEIVAEPEVAAAAPVEPAPPVEHQPEPEPVRADVVEQPTWRIVAPDLPSTPTAPALPTNGHPAVPEPAQPPVAATAATPPAPAADPQWPSDPQWPVAQPNASFLANRRTSASAATEALWAASARDVVANPAGAPLSGVQPCSSCGLSLSATARFCRRCGSRQGA